MSESATNAYRNMKNQQTTTDGPEPEPAIDLAAMSRDALRDIAATAGLDVRASASKADLIAAIESAGA